MHQLPFEIRQATAGAVAGLLLAAMVTGMLAAGRMPATAFSLPGPAGSLPAFVMAGAVTAGAAGVGGRARRADGSAETCRSLSARGAS